MNRILNFFSRHLSFVGLLLMLSLDWPMPGVALVRHLQIDQYVQNIWTTRNGLPACSINAILQTANGYIWLGTTAGLYRFDGVTFTKVSTSPHDSRTYETITALCQTSDGSLLIGTNSDGLRVFKDGRMHVYDSRDGFYNTGVRNLFEARSGHIFVGTNIGLFLFNGGRFVRIKLDQNFINGIAEDGKNRIWVGTPDGLLIFQDNGKTAPHVTHLTKGLPYLSVITVFEDNAGDMWVGTYGGLARFKDGQVTSYFMQNGLSSDRIMAITEDSNGNMWFGTDKGVDRFIDGTWSSFTSSDGLTDNEVLSFAEDREHSLWVGTADGLNQFEDPSIVNYSTEEGLAGNNVTSIVQARDSSIYFLNDHSTTMTRLKDGKFTRYENYKIYGGTAFAARDGSIWIGETGSLLNFKNGKLAKYGKEAGVPQRWISAIAQDSKSIIFYVDHAGLFRLIDGHATPYLLKGGKLYPKSDFIGCLYFRKDGTLWIGKGDGLATIKDGTLTDFTGKDGVPSCWITSFYDAGKGGLWIGTMLTGLILFKDGKFSVIDAKAGLFANEIYSVAGDSRGGLWMTSGRGIGYADQKDLEEYCAGKIQKIHSTVYGASSGMKITPFFNGIQPSGLEAYDGRVWFCTRKGAVMIDPGNLRKNLLPPPVLIENVVADQRSVFSGSRHYFAPGTKKLEFDYDALSFENPQEVFFKYKLIGYDRQWVNAGTRRVAYYTNLPPGRYDFKVIACNNDGVWNEAGANFGFELEPGFFQTFWFYGLMVLAMLGIAFGLYRLRVWQLLKREKQLNGRIQEAMARIKTLSGLIPICSNCKKIRDDEGYWENLEKYIQTHSDAQFSHGICPECYAKLYSDLSGGRKAEEP